MPTRTRFTCPVLIGRESQLESIRTAAREVLAKRGQVLLVAGVAGIGKTALLRRATELLRDDGLLVVAGSAAAAESSRPFGAFVDALRAGRSALGAADFDRLLNARAFEVRRLLPELGMTDLAPAESGAHVRILDAFELLMTDLAARTPIAILIDDLHWADEPTLSLFAYLARRASVKRLLLLGTFRTDELHRSHPLTARLVELERLALRIDLRPLAPAETAAMLRAALGTERDVAPQLKKLIHARADGNPFFTEELLKVIATAGRLSVDANQWTLKQAGDREVPATIRALVESRTSRLSAVGQQLLRVAAVMGQAFDLVVLCDVAGSSEAETVQVLRQAVESQLVDETDAPGTFRFRHALTREALVADLLRHEQAALHGAIGQAIERRAGTDPGQYDRLAYHFDEAGDTARAARYHELAASESARRLAFVTEIEHLERVIALRGGGDLPSVDLRQRLGVALRVAGQLNAALRALDDARGIASMLGDRHREGAALALSAGVLGEIGDGPGREAAYDRAIQILEPLGDSTQLANALAGRALSLVITGRVDAGLAVAPSALTMAKRVGTPEAEMMVHHAIGIALALRGSSDAIPALESALAFADQFPVAASHLLNNAVAAYGALGIPIAQQQELRQRQSQHAQRYGLSYRLRAADFTQAYDAGRWDDALRVYEELRYHENRLTGAASVAVTCIDIARRGPAEGRRIDRERARAGAGGSHIALHAWWMAGAVVETLEETEWLQAHPLAAGNFNDRPVAALYGLARATRVGSRDERSRWLERLRQLPNAPRESIVWSVMRSVGTAEDALDAGQLERALQLLGEAARRLATEESKVYESVLCVRRAEIAAAVRPEIARETINVLVDFWSKAGAAWFVSSLVKQADEWGLSVARPRMVRPKRGTGPLSDRELEVARHVADGLTNKQIAERLVLSERTVESHVERIREKLGVRNRAHIATWVADNALHVS